MSLLQTHYARLENEYVAVSDFSRSYVLPNSTEVAVLFSDYTNPQGETSRTFTVVTEAYVGKVVAMETVCERVMSDIWEDITYAWCANDDGSQGYGRHLHLVR